MPADQPTVFEIEPSFNEISPSGKLFVCKYTAAPTSHLFNFNVTATGGTVLGTGSFAIASTQSTWINPGCVEVWNATSSSLEQITVTEQPGLGWELYRVQFNGSDLPVSTTVTVSASTVSGPAFLVFKNRPTEVSMLPGRMTGGGHQFAVGNLRVTRGFTIHCDITLSNNIEINWPGNKWHLDKPISTADCVDDPTIDPAPPPAPFDTFNGTAVGRLNGEDGAFLRFTFIDAGEPGGDTDRATIQIWAPGANPAVDAPVLSVSGFLTGGNLQAHYDQPHK